MPATLGTPWSLTGKISFLGMLLASLQSLGIFRCQSLNQCEASLVWTCPGTTDTRTLRTIDPQNKEVLSAKGKTAISTRVQGRGRRTGPIFGQIHLQDRQGPWSLRHLFEKLG